MTDNNEDPTKDQSAFSALVPAKGKRFKVSYLLLPFAVVAIYSMIVPIVLLHIWTAMYQLVYFTALGIPKIKKNEYIRMERWDLNKLTFWQKINCVYCEYANGILAYFKAVANQTEIYSCAIRHQHALKGHEHEEIFYDAKKFN